MTVQKSLVVTSEGVASKRNFFEASAPSKAEPLAAKKVRAGIPWEGPVPGQAQAFWANPPRFGYQCTLWQAAGGSLVVVVRAGLGSSHRNCALAACGFVPMRWYLGSWEGAKVWAGLCLLQACPVSLCPGVCPGLPSCNGRAGAATLLSLSLPQDNLKNPGSVMSRINLWISRTQEPAKEEKSKVPACAKSSGSSPGGWQSGGTPPYIWGQWAWRV